MIAAPLHAEVSTPFAKALAGAVQDKAEVAAFYQGRGSRPLWTGPGDAARLQALMGALDAAGDHGLPFAGRAAELRQRAAEARTEGDLGRLEAALTEAYLAYGTAMLRGAVEGGAVDPSILRQGEAVDPADLLARIAQAGRPGQALRDLAPRRVGYVQLVKERLRLLSVQAVAEAAGDVAVGGDDRGAAGVVQVRARLAELGYLRRSARAGTDGALSRAIQRFQRDAGLNVDGQLTEATLAALNLTRAERIAKMTVALERLRWLGRTDLGARHVWVNQPDFTAGIVDEGRTTFLTRAVIGKPVPDQRTPEFSDEMEHLVVNPSWGVPRSITVKEYLPLLRRNPNAVAHLDVVDRNGRILPRGQVNFAAYSEKSFPYALRQAPSDGNALGKVKFMFPNPHNIYLHDTPAKNLFAHEVRAYSHGCIRLGQPIAFAHALLAAQSDHPEAEFEEKLTTGRESVMKLHENVPVHLVYFTAFPDERGRIQYRNDIYGRDALIHAILQEMGLADPAGNG